MQKPDISLLLFRWSLAREVHPQGIWGYFLSLVVYLYLTQDRRDLGPRTMAVRNQRTQGLNIARTKPWFPLLEGWLTILGGCLLSLSLFSFSVCGHSGLSDLVCGQLVDKRHVKFPPSHNEKVRQERILVTYCNNCKSTELGAVCDRMGDNLLVRMV